MWRIQPNAGGAAAWAPHSAHLENVGKIVCEGNGKHKTERVSAVVTQRQPLVNGVAPNKHRATDV